MSERGKSLCYSRFASDVALQRQSLFEGRMSVLSLTLALSLVPNAPTPDPRPQRPASKIDALFRDYDGADVPGACVMVIRDGQVLFNKAYGMANLEEKRPATTGTNFRLASVTKQFTAMAVMILAERGKLSYEDPLPKFFPDFPAYGTSITVRQLLNHTSGLIDYEGVIPPGTTRPLTDADVLNLMKRQDRTYFAPGSRFRYSNSGYAFLALIVEKVSGATFTEFLRENVLTPAGMMGSTFYGRDDRAAPNRAFGYTKRSDRFEPTDQSLTSSVAGDGSLYASLDDLFKWDRALNGATLVRPDTLLKAFTPGVGRDAKDTGYGFGWFIGRYNGKKVYWHRGGTVGFTAAISRFPNQKLTIVVLTNRSDVPLTKILDTISDMYLVDGE
jgi:CubicO group peptidase (beta-lactamase class C family)